jgi:TonB-dependent starch-binding outer membrane protein SusC
MKKFQDYYERNLFEFFSKKTFRVMKLTFFLSFLTIFQLWATETYSQYTKLTLKLEDVKISDALKEIENQSEFFFLYSPKLIDVERKVNIDAEKETIKDILTDIFTDKVKFAVYDRQVILSPIEQSGVLSEFQQQSITGSVKDESGNPLGGVTVKVKGTSIGIITDATGKYSLSNVGENATLIFSFIGMATQEIPLNGRTKIDVVLKQEAIGLDEVVVIGYGTIKKIDLTGSVTSVRGTSIVSSAAANPIVALQGRASGVQVIESGTPGTAPTIKIRGIGTTGNSEPLYVVDGMMYDNIQFLNSNDIESFDILKDASSTAIYGSRGANGVILITTKRGKSSKPSFSFTMYQGLEKPHEFNMVTATEFATLINEGYTYQGLAPKYADPESYGKGTQWFKEITRNAQV